MNTQTKKVTTIGMLCAMAMVLAILIYFPIVPAVPFLSYEPKDVIIVIGGFIYGPMVSFIMSAICSVLEIMFRGGTIIDVLMNVISTCTFACTATHIYKRNHTKKGAMLGLLLGMIASTISMTVWNYVVTPIYYNMPRSVVVSLLLPGIIPFNLLKTGINSAIALFLYKPVVSALRSSHLVSASQSHSTSSKDMIVFGLFLLISMIVFVLGMQGIL